MRMPSRGLAICLAVALSGLALGACTGGKDEPEESPSTSVSKSASPSPTQSSTSPSPSPSPSVSIPAEAMQQTSEGAVAFVKFFFDQASKAYTAPDATLIPPLGEATCKSCSALQAEVEELAASGHRYASEPAEISNVSVVSGAVPDGQQMVTMTLRQGSVAIINSAGDVVSTTVEKVGDRKAIVVWKGDRWFVVDIG